MEKNGASEAAPLEFSNDMVKCKVHFKPACRVELEVDAVSSLVSEAHKQAVKSVGKRVSSPGFRKGQAPAFRVEKSHPKEVDSETQKEIANLALKQCLTLCKVPVLNNDYKFGFNVKSYSLQEGAKLILFFETEPTLPEIDPTQIKLKEIERPIVNDEKVKEMVRQSQLFFAKWTPITDRGIQDNDFVILDVDIIEENPPRSLFSGVRFEVTQTSMAEWMRNLILGHHKDEVLEGISVPDADASEKDQKDLSPKKVKVTIREVESAQIPELNDDFAKKMGVKSVEELFKNVEKILNDKADAHVQEKMREQVSGILLNDFKFDVPASLIDREVRVRMHQVLQDPDYLKYWNQMTNEAKNRTVASVAEQSEKAVRMFYLCRKILKDAKISISPNDIPKVSDQPLEALMGQGRENHPQGNTEMHQAEAFSRLLLEKAENYIISKASKIA